MAKVCGATFGLCVLFLLIISESETKFLKDDGYGSYDVISFLPNLEFLDTTYLIETQDSHSRIKREFNLLTPLSNSSIAETTPQPQQPQQPQLTPQQRTNSRQLDPTLDTITSTTTLPPSFRERPLLGVNGTGQKKDIPLPKPFVVSEPINPNTVNNNKTKVVASAIPTSKPIGTVAVLPDDDISIDNVDKFDVDTNKTLLQNNLTQFEEDYHVYYNSTMLVDEVAIQKYWKTIKNFTVNNLLSKSYRRAMTVQLSFDFPFYGHPIRNVTVATGGFLYTGEYVHSWLAATQYIAPLMANFDTSLSNDSYVKYNDNGTTFTVVWENVTLHEKPNVGSFTFSASLHKSGDIVFAYYSIPLYIESINDDTHPVKVGLSDAYIIDKTIFFARRKTIYEYHRVNFGNEDIKNGTMIYLNAQPSCLTSKDCESCLTSFPTLRCNWCPTINRCSTGMDRKRQDWLQKGCEKTQILDTSTCPKLGEKGNNAADQPSIPGDISDSNLDGIRTHVENSNNAIDDHSKAFLSHIADSTNDDESTQRSSFGMILGVLLPIGLVMTAVLWIFYAYRNPHTKSGQFLIQYRPSQWSWRRGEARYTAATIHM